MGACVPKESQVLNQPELHNAQNVDIIPAPKGKFKAFVYDVYDGDTITIIYTYRREPFKAKLRLVGINAPEIRTKNLQEKKSGLEAKEYLKSLVHNKYVYVEITGPDKYYRLDGKVYLNDVIKSTVNDDMLSKGYAVEYNM